MISPETVLATKAIGLDTLDRSRFEELARRDRLTDVIGGLNAARDAGPVPVKINAVLLRGVHDDETLPLLEWGEKAGHGVDDPDFLQPDRPMSAIGD